ncbi:MAG TPA: glycoside hydrolase family 9 protein [Ruminococcus sp.]|nr:glycoside hydrolase family 9 protein [Ruminococcus sp.]
MLKKITSGLVSAVMLAGSLGTVGTVSAPLEINAAATEFNYAEALQKSLYFYECQQAGPLPEWNRVEWRGDSTMDDEIKGGWYDAGDHVKFNLPMAYSASMLAWGLYQYPDGVEQSGEMQNYVNNLEFVLDYFVDCDLGDEVVIQVGNGTVDHTWWGPVEVLEYGMQDSGTSLAKARAVEKVSGGASCVLGDMAAALAAGYAALDGRIDEKKRQNYLKHAKHLYEMASTDPGDSQYAKTDAEQGGFYRSSHFYDELFYSANWLYIATGDKGYLEQADKDWIPHLGKERGLDELAFSWTHCWDDTMQGGLLLYALNTKDEFYISRVKRHLDYAVDNLKKVDGVLAYYDGWGCARYAETDGFLAAVASEFLFKGQPEEAKYEKYAEQQINYVLGDNPLNLSYMVGYGPKCAHNSHHRTAHGSWKNDLYMPVDNRHTLYGALAGGPTEAGTYVDDRNNYTNNEVATDYNAGMTALLCRMIDKYGGKSDPTFPPKEAHDGPEFYVETLSKGADASGMTLSFKVTNHSAWPARRQDNISFRYYMDMSEVIAAGKNPADVVIRCDRDQSKMYADKGIAPAEISEMTQYDGDIWYVEVNLPDGRAVLPVSEGMQQCEILLAFVMPDYGSGWDATNDFSNKELLGGKASTSTPDGKVTGIVTPYVPVYVNGKLYYGYEPDGTYADGMGGNSDEPKVTTTTATTTKKITTTTTTTTAPSPEPTTTTTTPPVVKDRVWGDADCDGNVKMNDAVLIMQSLSNADRYGVDSTEKGHITEEGQLNANVYENSTSGITPQDALYIQKWLLKMFPSLDPKDFVKI